MQTPLPSVWYLTMWHVVTVTAALLLVGGLIMAVDLVGGLSLMGFGFVMFVGFELLAAGILRRSVAAFVQVMEDAVGPGHVIADRHGRLAVEWPAAGVRVGGELRRYTVRGFGYAVGQDARPVRLRAAAVAAEVALSEIGRPVRVRGRWAGRLPLGVTAATVFGWVLLGVVPAGLLLWLPSDAMAFGISGAVGLLGVVLWFWGALRHRAGAVGFIDGLAQGGTDVGAPTVMSGGVRLRWYVPTSRGPLRLEGMALGPMDRLVVSFDGGTERVPLADAKERGAMQALA